MTTHAAPLPPPTPADRLERARAAFRAAQHALEAARDELLTAERRAARDPRPKGQRR